ncbi:carboxypeptidase-like regulatory domain-containing protein [Aquimarina algicola]|uniref:Carboxypeptidase-like regulatory domain-containing protein n=2 Tax=Aquimarina algicola TaxID=2589995 RepID=A0A504JH48_9FLAO|nr:carboxypeptidase-like regulatory domain-containing protein [Aquimarina algicola]
MNMNYHIFLVFFSLVISLSGKAQTISSKVIDKNTNQPIPYATIQISEEQGIITNEEGRFTLNLDQSTIKTDSIHVSSMGYERVSLAVNSVIDSIIYITPKAIELKSVFVSNKNLTVDEIIENVIDRLEDNYHFDMTQQRLFYRQSDFNKLNKLSLEFKKSTIEELNKKFIDSVTRLIPRKSEYYIETLCDFYGDLDKRKINIIKAAELYDKNNLGSMDDLSKRLEKIFKENVKPDSYLKIKSGIFGTKVQVDSILENDNEAVSAAKDQVASKNKNKFVKHRKSTLKDLLGNMFFYEDSKLNFIHKPGRYLFKLEDYTYIDDSSVYIITFSPKRREDFKGTIYVNTQDYAIMRVEYQNVKWLRNFKLLGLSYKETLYKGKTIFTKGLDQKYTLKYLEKTQGNTFGVDRPLKVIEKNKHVKGRRKQNELSLDIDAVNKNVSKFEVVVFNTKQLTESAYNNSKENKSIRPKYLSQYNPGFWKGYNIIEPNTAIREFTAAPDTE